MNRNTDPPDDPRTVRAVVRAIVIVVAGILIGTLAYAWLSRGVEELVK